MRTMRTLAVTAALVAGACTATIVPAHAQDQDNSLGEFGFSLTATQALVNTSGGFTASGTMDCTAAVDSALSAAEARVGTDNVALAPDNGMVGANVSYTVTENVGRTKTVSAAYNSGIQQPCYIAPGGTSNPWTTLYPYPVGTQQWLYSTTGKFQPGSVHIELFGETHITIDAYDSTGTKFTFTAALYALNGVNLKATMARSH